MALSIKHPTLGFSTGHDLTVCEIEPQVGLCTDSVEPAWDSVSPPLSAYTLLMLCLKINKLTKMFLGHQSGSVG